MGTLVEQKVIKVTKWGVCVKVCIYIYIYSCYIVYKVAVVLYKEKSCFFSLGKCTSQGKAKKLH